MKRCLFTIILSLTITQALFAQSEHYWVNKAAEKIKNGDFEGAIADCNKALAINSGCAEAYNNRGVAETRLHNFEDALTNLDRAITIDPKYETGLTNRADVEIILGRYSEAVNDCNSAIALSPNDTASYFFRGYAYYKIGGNEEIYRKAISDYETFYKLGGKYTYENYSKNASDAIINLGNKTYLDEPSAKELDRLSEDFERKLSIIKYLQPQRTFLSRRDSLVVLLGYLHSPWCGLRPMAANPGDEHSDLTYYNFRTSGPMFNYLCKKAILISRKTNPKPPIPEEARENYVIGVSILNDPSNYKKEDFYPSLKPLLYANIDAPWWYAVYKQLGRANELAENYEEAKRNYQLYLLTRPPVDEARKIRDEIYVIEGKQMRNGN